MNLQRKTLLKLSGAVWILIGVMLLNLGVHFLMQLQVQGQEKLIIALIVTAVLAGHMKGRFMLSKVAAKSFQRISKLQEPCTIFDLYTKGNIAVIGLMMLLGMTMKFLALHPGLRGFIDVAVGSALIQGAMSYFALSGKIIGTQTKV